MAGPTVSALNPGTAAQVTEPKLCEKSLVGTAYTAYIYNPAQHRIIDVRHCLILEFMFACYVKCHPIFPLCIFIPVPLMY